MNGLITKSIGGLYTVEVPFGVSNTGTLECKARGIFRKQNISPCVGDRVSIEEIAGDTGVIAEIHERKNHIVRPALANLDRIVFVVSTCEPSPNLMVLDKFIAIAEYKDIATVIAVTKRDLLINDEIKHIYKNSGAEVIEIDYDDPASIAKVRDMLSTGISAFTGNTGVGKSTLLGSLDESFAVQTGEISRKLGRGRHTTRHIELYKLGNGGYIADTPGFSTLDVGKYDVILKDKLELCFREFAPLLGSCRYQGCSHTKEEDCAVIAAVNAGEIPKSRFESYIAMYGEAKDIKEWETKRKF